MNQVDGALATLAYYIRAFLGLLLGVFAIIEGYLRELLEQLGIPGGIQSVVILVVAILFIVAVIRLLGGFLRVVLLLFLLLLLEM